jgi:hypothetical protein
VTSAPLSAHSIWALLSSGEPQLAAQRLPSRQRIALRCAKDAHSLLHMCSSWWCRAQSGAVNSSRTFRPSRAGACSAGGGPATACARKRGGPEWRRSAGDRDCAAAWAHQWPVHSSRCAEGCIVLQEGRARGNRHAHRENRSTTRRNEPEEGAPLRPFGCWRPACARHRWLRLVSVEQQPKGRCTGRAWCHRWRSTCRNLHI